MNDDEHARSSTRRAAASTTDEPDVATLDDEVVPAVRRTTTRQLVAIGLVLTLLVLLLASLRFGRYDWSGIPLERLPETTERQVSPDCLEIIQPYTTESGREVGPIAVDDQQYLALIAHYRGVPFEDLQIVCFYDPFTNRSGMSWIAHWLPFEEALALSTVNVVMMVLALWCVLATLRVQGFSPRVVLVAGTLFGVGWNTLFFSSVLLIDPGSLALISLGWFLLAIRRPWFVVPILLLGYPIKETVGILVFVLAAWAWQETRAGRRSPSQSIAVTAAGALAFVVGVAFWRHAQPQAAAAWDVLPEFRKALTNLFDIVSLGGFSLGVLPLYLPAALWFRRKVQKAGWLAALRDPAFVGAVMALGISGWTFITVDLTPRLMWIGFPFAATLAARWLSLAAPSRRLEKLPMPKALVGGDRV